jgi:hypothetical protein
MNRLKEASPEISEYRPSDHRSQVAPMADTRSNQPIVTSHAAPVTRMLATASCRTVRIEIESTWGDPGYVGLCGLEVLHVVGSELRAADIDPNKDLDASPRDLSSVGFFDDPRRLENLVNGVNDLAQDDHMWLIPFTKNALHHIQVDLRRSLEVAGIRVWNYNKSSEDVLRGARRVSILLDGRRVCSAILRMGPGCDGVSYAQTVLFEELFVPTVPRQLTDKRSNASSLAYTPAALKQDFEVSSDSPTGLLWRFTFFDNWNDEFYVGLDRIEMFDVNNVLIDIVACGAQINAVPFSVQDLASGGAQLSHDPRVPSSLFRPAASGAHNCWLCPLSRCMTPDERVACVRRIQGSNKGGSLENLNFPKNNTLFVSFQVPTTVTSIRFFNYSKTPARGVREMGIELDGQLLFMGTLQPAHK